MINKNKVLVIAILVVLIGTSFPIDTYLDEMTENVSLADDIRLSSSLEDLERTSNQSESDSFISETSASEDLNTENEKETSTELRNSEIYEADSVEAIPDGLDNLPEVDENNAIKIEKSISSNIKDGWFTEEYDGNWYYIKDGKRLKNEWLYYLSDWYYFDLYGNMAQNKTLTVDAKLYLFDQEGKWVTKPGWHEIKGYNYKNWYYVLPDGLLQTGWFEQAGNWYYLQSLGGEMSASGTFPIHDKYYAFDSSGKMMKSKGWQKIAYNFNDSEGDNFKEYSKWVYFLENGDLYTGWLKENDKWYFFYDDGIMVSNSIGGIRDNFYLFNEDGSMKTKPGWNNLINDYGDKGVFSSWYYLLEDGRVKTVWLKENNLWYLFDYYGRMVSNTTGYIDNNIYLFNEDGSMRTTPGWNKIAGNYYDDDEWFYLSEEGTAKIGWFKDGEDFYYFYKTGRMVKNDLIYDEDGVYALDSNGHIVKNGWFKVYDNDWVYANSNGKLHTGWLVEGEYTYYFGDNSLMVADDIAYTNEGNYVFGSDGRMLRNSWYQVANYYEDYFIYASATGKLHIGWLINNGNTYYFYEDNRMAKDNTINIEGIDYTFDSNGILQ